MTYRGHIRNGVAVLDTPVTLPDGTRVTIEVDRAEASFWRGKGIDELAHEQGVKPIHDVGELAVEWPDEDSIDEFLTFVREARR